MEFVKSICTNNKNSVNKEDDIITQDKMTPFFNIDEANYQISQCNGHNTKISKNFNLI